MWVLNSSKHLLFDFVFSVSNKVIQGQTVTKISQKCDFDAPLKTVQKRDSKYDIG